MRFAGQYGCHRQEEILDVRTDRMRQIFRQVLVLAGEEFLERIRMVDIERRDQARLAFGAFILQPLRITLEHRLAQRPDTH